MQIVTFVTILLYQCQRLLVNDELFLEATAMGGLIVGFSDIRDGDALRTILGTYPVGIGQIDANSR